jgi:hypothetical protein
VTTEALAAERPEASTARTARRMAAGAGSHLGPAVKGTAGVLWRALGQASAMSLVAPAPERKR